MKNDDEEMNAPMPVPSSFSLQPFALRDAPALIERLLPVQKLSAEAYKEQMAGSGKTLTAIEHVRWNRDVPDWFHLATP